MYNAARFAACSMGATKVRQIMASKNSHTGYRDSKNGEFVTERTAERRPATTQKESIPNPGRGDAGRGQTSKRK